MRIVVGNVVRGDDLYGRERELRNLWNVIDTDSLMLISPRRYGKTSLVTAMKDNPKSGWTVLYMDMEGFSDPVDFITELLKRTSPALIEKTRRIFSSVSETVEELYVPDMVGIKLGKATTSWQEKGTKVFSEIKKENPNTIIVVDELPTYLLNIDEKSGRDGITMSVFLHWLRGIRQDMQIRFIFCGSIGLDTVIDRHDLSTSVNDIRRISLEPFEHDTAKDMVSEILGENNIVYDELLIDEILVCMGIPVPFFLQLMLREIQNQTDFGKIPLSVEIIRGAYTKGLLGTEGRRDFQWYFDRLKKEFDGKDHQAALEILRHLTSVEHASARDLEAIHSRIMLRDDREAFVGILRKLVTGFYIRHADDKIMFHNKVLRDLWMMDHGEQGPVIK